MGIHCPVWEGEKDCCRRKHEETSTRSGAHDRHQSEGELFLQFHISYVKNDETNKHKAKMLPVTS